MYLSLLSQVIKKTKKEKKQKKTEHIFTPALDGRLSQEFE